MIKYSMDNIYIKLHLLAHCTTKNYNTQQCNLCPWNSNVSVTLQETLKSEQFLLTFLGHQKKLTIINMPSISAHLLINNFH